MTKWNYEGDQDLACGGFYWREDGSDDYVLIVQVTPCSDAGGPDNLFYIEKGSVYIPEEADKRQSALDVIGETLATATRRDLVYAMRAHSGIDRDCWAGETVIRIGDECEFTGSPRGWSPVPDYILDESTDLREYVETNFLA